MALKTRVVVVGLGSIGRRHARLLHERGDLAVEFCEPNDGMLDIANREIGELPVFRSYRDALDSKPDIMVIATPHQYHGEQTVAALENGVHVLCEKPMSDSLETAEKMRRAAQKSGALLNIGFMLHFNPGLNRLKQLIESDALGTVLAINYKIGSYITLVNSRSRYQSEMEDALLMDYAHQPDTIYWLLGKKPAGVYCSGAAGGDMGFSSVPNVLTLVCDYDTALLATITLNYLQMPERQECEIIGDRGWALLDLKAGEIRIGDRDTDSMTVEPVPIVRDEMYQDEHQMFLDAVGGKGGLSSPADDAIVSMLIIDAAIVSRREGRRVPID